MASARISAKGIQNQHVSRALERQMDVIYAEIIEDNAQLKESFNSYTKAMLDLDNVGWAPLNSISDTFELQERHELAKKARKMTEENPLLKRGASFRANNIFGRGAPIEGELAPRFQKIIDDPANQNALFNVEAQIAGENGLFTDGVYFNAYFSKDRVWERIPFEQITDAWFNPERPSEIWYFRRYYQTTQTSGRTGKTQEVKLDYWMPVDTYNSNSHPAKIMDIPVRSDVTVVPITVNKLNPVDSIGLPDCYAAMPWAWAYSEGLRDGLKLIKSLATIAWLVKQKSAKGTANVGAKIATKGRGAGQTAVATEGTELTSLPRSNAVDLTTLRPIASMVATALEVSTVVVLSDSGAASGSNAAETTLDTPTTKSSETRQQLWANYYQRCFRVMGIPASANIALNFPKISVDPVWRVLQGLTLAFKSGAISQEEYRLGTTEAMDIVPISESMPKPNAWTGTLKNNWTDEPSTGTTGTTNTDGEDNPSVLPSQGDSGQVGSIDQGTNDARSNGEFE